MMQKVYVKRTKRLHTGHLWVFSNEISGSLKTFEPGAPVEVFDLKEECLGAGYINPNSLIAVRLLTRQRRPVDEELLRERIAEAVSLRSRFFPGAGAVRLVYSEGDFLPGLIVDRYGDCLVIQILTAGMERFKEVIVRLLDGMLGPSHMVIKNESRSRLLEGLPLYREVVKGGPQPLPAVRENGLIFEVDPLEGQKTGFFLDQKANRAAFAALLRGGRGLDLFSYTGAWSLALAAAGASVTGVDESERAVQRACRNAELNGLGSRAAFIASDVFSFLGRERDSGGEPYDFVVLDPPAFVKSAAKLKEAVKAYRELNAACMRLLKPGGLLATSSCSYHLGREMFLDVLRVAARDSGRDLRMIELRGQDRDHPVNLAMPETEYLKCAFLVVD